MQSVKQSVKQLVCCYRWSKHGTVTIIGVSFKLAYSEVEVGSCRELERKEPQ